MATMRKMRMESATQSASDELNSGGARLMGMKKYTLNEKGTPVHEPDLITWARWLVSADRKVANETIGEAEVSTVFLGTDHNWGYGPPILWETMVFGGLLDQERYQCSGNREQAEAMHAEIVAKVRQSAENGKRLASAHENL